MIILFCLTFFLLTLANKSYMIAFGYSLNIKAFDILGLNLNI